MGSLSEQFSTLCGIFIYLMCSGMHIYWAIFSVGSLEKWKIDSTELGVLLTNSILFLGGLIGAVTAGIFIDRLGRKKTMYLPGLCFIISGLILIIFQKTITVIILGEGLAGISMGMVGVIFTIYTGEISKKENRGLLIACGSIMTTIGSLIFSFCTYYVGYDTPEPLLLIGILTLCDAILGLFFCHFLSHESPVYLCFKHKEEEAKSVLTYLRREINSLERIPDTDLNSFEVDEHQSTIIEDEINDIKKYQSESKVRFINKNNLKPLGYLLLIKAVTSVAYNYQLNTIIVGTFYVGAPGFYWFIPTLLFIRGVTTFTFLWIYDKKNRIKILLISANGTFGSIFIAAILFIFLKNLENNFYILPCGLFILLQIFIGFGINPIPDILLSEYLPMRCKSFSTVLVFLFDYILQIFFLLILTNITLTFNSIFILLFIISGLLLLIIIFLIIFNKQLPNTKYKTLYECRKLFK